jgi:hypothetical protein
MARAWRELGQITDLEATGGSSTTIVSTYSPFTADDNLNNGTAIVVRDAGGAGAAPEGQFSVITDYVASTKTWTIGALTAGVASGDYVALAKPTIRLAQMRQAVNDALAALGTISLVDTSLATVSGQTEFAIPVALKIKKLKDVLIQRSTDSSDGYYTSVKGLVRDFPAAPAATGLLQFTQELAAGYTIKIVYEGVHPTLNAYDDVVSETIQEELIAMQAAEKAMSALIAKRGASATNAMRQEYNKIVQKLAAEKFEKPITRSPSKPKFFISGM